MLSDRRDGGHEHHGQRSNVTLIPTRHSLQEVGGKLNRNDPYVRRALMSKYQYVSLRWKPFINAEHTCSLQSLRLVTSTLGRRSVCYCPPGVPGHADVLIAVFVWAKVQADHEVTLRSGVLWNPLVFAKETLKLSTWIGWTLDRPLSQMPRSCGAQR